MAVEPADAPRILVVRRDNIGDLVCTTPLLAALRQKFARAWIGALVNTYNAPVLEGNPDVDAVFAYEKLKHRSSGLLPYLRSRLALVSELRKQRLDFAIVPAGAPQALKLARSLKPGRIVTRESDAGPHEVERTYALGGALGITGRPGPMRVYPHLQSVKLLQQQIGQGPFLAVHISARRPAQRWPRERYVALARKLAEERKVMLLWSPGASDDPRHPGDDEAAQEIKKACGALAVPTPDLRTLIAALSLAERVVCPDGGAMHLAAALGKPIVALFGDSPVERWRPWGVAHRVVQPQSKDLADLPLEPVLEACRSLG